MKLIVDMIDKILTRNKFQTRFRMSTKATPSDIPNIPPK